jgi:hypothetical protein
MYLSVHFSNLGNKEDNMNGSQVEVEYLAKKLRKIHEEKKHTADEKKEEIENIEKNLVFELSKRISEHPDLLEKLSVIHQKSPAS